MRIVFCWSNISGYMASCWHELAARPGVELHVLAYGDSRESGFGKDLMDGLSWTSLSESQRMDSGFVRRSVEKFEPDAIAIAGWLDPAYMALAKASSLRGAAFFMGMDTPWRDTPRQRLARFALRGYLSRLNGVFVPGERAWQFARRLGISESLIHRGMYGVDWKGFGESFASRSRDPWPRAFLFAGRYAEEKGVDTLVEAYRIYRERSKSPWKLNVCGIGPLASLFEGQAGICDHGFLQPAATRDLMARSGALVLPSRYDPWPLIVVEGASSGLPLVVSEACGSAVELLRPHFNGLFTPPHCSPEELATAMLGISDCRDLAAWGERSRALAEPYSARNWADRWLAALQQPTDHASF